jgi:hypothetical protein
MPRTEVPRILFANQNASLAGPGDLQFIVKQDEPWAADDPLVRRWPGYFGPEPVRLLRSVPAPAPR